MNDYSAFAPLGHNQPAELPEITKLAEATYAAQQKVETLEHGLKIAKEELQDLSENKLPEAMDDVGLSTYKTTSGISVEVAEKIRANLSVENRPKGFQWLEDNGYSGMIKTKVVSDFKRGELEKANDVVNDLRKQGIVANIERKVEPMTLTAFIKEHLQLGKDIPLDIFGVYRQRIAKVEI